VHKKNDKMTKAFKLLIVILEPNINHPLIATLNSTDRYLVDGVRTLCGLIEYGLQLTVVVVIKTPHCE
jgi:hypothetical protein